MCIRDRTESVSFLKWLYFAIVPDKRSLDESGSYETRLWKIKTVTHTEAAEESAETVPDKYPADEAAVKQIKSRIGYTYPHKNDEGIPTKVTVKMCIRDSPDTIVRIFSPVSTLRT